MDITATKVALACAASTLITGLDLVRTEHQQPAGSADRASLHKAVNGAWMETGLMTVGAGLLAALGHVPAAAGVVSKVTPAAVTLAFAAGTALSVVQMQHEADGDPKGSTAKWLSHDGAVGSSFETAGLVALGVGMLPQVQGTAKRAMIGSGIGLLAVGWPTSLGHGPIAVPGKPGSSHELAPGPLPRSGDPAAPKPNPPVWA